MPSSPSDPRTDPGKPAVKRTSGPLLVSWALLIGVLGVIVPLAGIPLAIYGAVIARRAGARGYEIAYGSIAVLSAIYLCVIVYVLAL